MKLSIIIPIYNSEKYLVECLESLTQQAFDANEVEIICVNDGSTDGSEKIIDEYSEKYDYFKKINQPNSGVSCARNTGIEASTGDYITFVDSDDYVAENAYLPIIDICYKENLDAFYYAYAMSAESDDFFAKYAMHQLTDMSKVEAVPYKIVRNYNSPVVWLVIYNAKLIKNNNIRFDQLMSRGEDNVFNLEFEQYVNKAAKSDLCIYFYRSTPGSLMHKKQTAQQQLSVLRELKIYLKFKKNRPELISFTEGDYAQRLFVFMKQQMCDKTSAKETLDNMKQYEISPFDILYLKHDSKINFRKKILIYIFCFPVIYRITCFIYRISR